MWAWDPFASFATRPRFIEIIYQGFDSTNLYKFCGVVTTIQEKNLLQGHQQSCYLFQAGIEPRPLGLAVLLL